MTRPDRTSGEAMPLYYRIFMVLQREIADGAYPADTPLPGEQALAQRFEVSRVTIRHAMAMLETEGLILRRRGKGTFAVSGPRARAPLNSFDGLNRNIAEFEAGTSVRLLQAGPAPLPRWAASHAGGRAQAALRILRVRADATGPFSCSACYLTARAAALVDPARLGNRTVLATLEDAGLAAARVEQRLTAVAADPAIAGHLGIAAGAPLIEMRRAMFDAAGAAFEFLEVHYRPDRFEYSVNLTREEGGTGAPRWVSRQAGNGGDDPATS